MSLGPVLCFHVDDKIMQLQAAFERIISLEMFYDGVYYLWKQLWERENWRDSKSVYDNLESNCQSTKNGEAIEE